MTSSDLCFSAAQQLINKNNVDLNDIGALIFVSQTPDYQLPATLCTSYSFKHGLPAKYNSIRCQYGIFRLRLCSLYCIYRLSNRTLKICSSLLVL